VGLVGAKHDIPLLEVAGATKRFPGVVALSEVDLKLYPGEVLALIGENGAGKSTLMKILAGVQMQDEGDILIDGKVEVIDSVEAALGLGISLIHQELNLSDNLSVGANIFLGREPLNFGLIDEATIERESRGVLERVGLDVDPSTIVGDLPIGYQQLIEIAKALSVNARVLIMDEPTSSLSQHETAQLFEVVKDLRSKGVSIVYISHRLGEVKELADRVTVFRDGKNAGELARDEIDHDNMVKLMVGRDVSQFYHREHHELGEVMLEVCDLRTPTHPGHELSFTVRAGEIVGVAGLVGAGRTEMLRTIFGVDRAVAGEIVIDGDAIAMKCPTDAINAGISLVPEDRKLHGLVIEMTVRHNTSLAGLSRYQKRGGMVNWEQEDDVTHEMIDKLRIKTPGPDQITQYLSGGNQQKVVIGKWLNMQPRVLMMDEPTRGIDVGAKEEIYRLMESLARQGVAILYVSSEMEEILGMADRAIVMHEGRITGELLRSELSEESVMQLATGREKVAALVSTQ